MRKCKCIYCKGEFDRDKEPFVQVSNLRYAHKACAEKNQVQKSQSELDYEKLVDYIEELFGVGYINAKIAKQIKDYREQCGYTYSGMLGTLVYWYEVKNGQLENANGGIGIIGHIYEEAKAYYTKIRAANAVNAGVYNYKPKVVEITIAPPRPEERKPRLFNLEEEVK